jgi:hypothetical protein
LHNPRPFPAENRRREKPRMMTEKAFKTPAALAAYAAEHGDVSAIELVAFAYRCPGCGERHVDNLVWIDDETVKCATCGALYDPNEEV